MNIVYGVMYGPGEPDGVYTMAVCATRERAEQEILNLAAPRTKNGLTVTLYGGTDNMWVEEIEVMA